MLQNPVHTYTSPGTYDVSLTVGNDQGSDILVRPGYITVNQIVGGDFVRARFESMVVASKVIVVR